jgi:uncharacterized protein (TIGR02452 family)
MNRTLRVAQATETLEICERGFYSAPSGKSVSVADAVQNAKSGTRLYSSECPPVALTDTSVKSGKITVINETAFSAIKRLAPGGGHVGCLNFASAKNPGGGFLNGAQAQEEALARTSGLYPSLLMAPDYYERNRKNRSTIYLDLAIYSPLVPFFRDDEGHLLEEPLLASVITAPAPNAGAVAQNEPHNLPLLQPALERRTRLVLQIAKAHQVDKLVLGAWGCGVFRNDPQMVAATFARLLTHTGDFATAFQEVVFAVFDRTGGQETFGAFAETFIPSVIGAH